MGDVAELIAVVFIGAFYGLSFVATCALVEVGYLLVERLKRK